MDVLLLEKMTYFNIINVYELKENDLQIIGRIERIIVRFVVEQTLENKNKPKRRKHIKQNA